MDQQTLNKIKLYEELIESYKKSILTCQRNIAANNNDIAMFRKFLKIRENKANFDYYRLEITSRRDNTKHNYFLIDKSKAGVFWFECMIKATKANALKEST